MNRAQLTQNDVYSIYQCLNISIFIALALLLACDQLPHTIQRWHETHNVHRFFPLSRTGVDNLDAPYGVI